MRAWFMSNTATNDKNSNDAPRRNHGRAHSRLRSEMVTRHSVAVRPLFQLRRRLRLDGMKFRLLSRQPSRPTREMARAMVRHEVAQLEPQAAARNDLLIDRSALIL